MTDCIFCKIILGEMATEFIYEDDLIVAFHDICPKAKVHALVVPKMHIQSLNELSAKDSALISHITLKLPAIAVQLGLIEGFRTIINTGPGGGQEVPHIHYHILGGGKLSGLQ